ncbi:MAG TPA: 4Fe-4S binding protein, partial [Bacteroidales bacterium]|nr:4Fe-4S binding protein [Bacteroidales bacterium]
MSKKRVNFFRGVLQWTIIALLAYMVVRPWFDKGYYADFEAYCPFGGMQALMSYLNSHSLACSMTTVQIGLGIALIAGVLLFAKLFCSFICPIGTFTEWLGSLGRRVKLNFTIKGTADRVLRVIKYALLFITVYFSVSSSELFCRTFDPYYVLFSGFGGDTVMWYAIPAILLTIVGSFFIRQLWCKYLCPLGAITNIAIYALPASALALLFVIINRFAGGLIQWYWLLAAICLMGFILESTTLRFLIFPPIRITRHPEICTNCRICDKKCPMALNISTIDKVQHIDCHLCTDCVAKCPEKGALTVNKRWPRWLPALITVVLIAAALFFSNRYEIPTISEHWGSPELMKTASVVEMSGLKNI